MDEVKGKFLLKIDGLLNEFNPELAGDCRKKLKNDINTIQPEEWYDNMDLRNYIGNVSPTVKKVLGKKLLDVATGFDKLVQSVKDPVELIKFTVKMDHREDFKKKNLIKPEVIDSGPDFITLKLDTDGSPELYEGVYLGMLERYKIVRTHVKTTSEMVDGNEISTMEIKWG